MSTAFESTPQLTDREPTFVVDKDIYSWPEIDRELTDVREDTTKDKYTRGIMIAAIAADRMLLNRPISLTKTDKESISAEIEHSRQNLAKTGYLADRNNKEIFYANLYNATLAGEKPSLTDQEKQAFIDDFDRLKNKPGSEADTARRAAQIRVLAVELNEELFDNAAADLLKNKLEQMQDEDDPIEDIIAYAADMKIAGIKEIKLPTSIIQTAVDQLYQLQDDGATAQYRHLGANLSILVRQDILSQLDLE